MSPEWIEPRSLELTRLPGKARALAADLRARADGRPSAPGSLERELARRLGGPGALDGPVPAEAATALEELLDAGGLAPRARLGGGRMVWSEDILTFPGPGLRIASRFLARFFAGPALEDAEAEFEEGAGRPANRPERGALFVATIGAGFEDASRKAFACGDLLRGVLLDALGSVLAEAAAAEAQAEAAALLGPAPQRGGVRRFCVGFGDWSLEGQADLFRCLGPEAIGVELTPSFLMVPEKSVAGLAAWKVRINPPPFPGR